MASELDYLQAFYPERFTILGQRLQPFSLGHLMLLRQMGNGFVCPDCKPSIPDLTSGIFVCSQSYSQAQRGLESRLLRFRMFVWGARVRRANFVEKMLAFTDYLEAGSTFPDMPDASERARIPGSPLIQRVRLTLQGELGLTQSEAMDYPWGAALHEYFALLEMKNRTSITNDEERETMKEHEEMVAAMKEEIEAGKANLPLVEGGWKCFAS